MNDAESRACKKRLSGRLSFLMKSLILFLLIIIPYVNAAWDPYKVLGLERDTSIDHIKKAYRELARKLHPDKSSLDENESGRRFIELNRAFSILKDPEKRAFYDRHGETEDTRRHHGQRGYNHRRQRENWSQNGYRTYTFFSSPESTFRRKTITSSQYFEDYVEQSKFKPQLVLFYANFCPSCSMIENAWNKITEELSKYDIGAFTINVNQEPRLAQDLGVSSIPHIACLLDGQIKHYHVSELSLQSIVRFIKSLLPNNLITTLKTDYDQDRFIALAPQQNRLSAIFIDSDSNIKFKYLLAAYDLRHYYKFGYISTKTSQFKLLESKYNLTLNTKTRQSNVIVFDENIKRPIITEEYVGGVISLANLKQRLSKWPFLQLPKLSSQQRFDDLCFYSIPKTGDKTKQKICIILFAVDSPATLPTRNKLIEFIRLNNLARNDQVVFGFIDPSKQTEFVASLLSETASRRPSFTEDSSAGAIIILERDTGHNRKALFRWLDARWDPLDLQELDKAKIELYQLIEYYRNDLDPIRNKVALSLLIDEEGPGLVNRVFWRMIDGTLRTIFYITSRESFSTIVILILCAMITSLFLYQSPISSTTQSQSSNSNYDAFSSQDTDHHDRTPTKTYAVNFDNEMKIMELKAETYNGLVRLLKPGYRSIILLNDTKSKDVLLEKFKSAVWPYRKNKTLLFGYLCLDKNIDWYKSLLKEVLGVDELNVNKKNCIGTVLSLNGFKKYLRVYHAKHHEIDYYDDETENDGSFLGFDDDDNKDDIEKANQLSSRMNDSLGDDESVGSLLDKLPIWLDKMFDGLTKRYFLEKWPEEIK